MSRSVDFQPRPWDVESVSSAASAARSAPATLIATNAYEAYSDASSVVSSDAQAALEKPGRLALWWEATKHDWSTTYTSWMYHPTYVAAKEEFSASPSNIKGSGIFKNSIPLEDLPEGTALLTDEAVTALIHDSDRDARDYFPVQTARSHEDGRPVYMFARRTEDGFLADANGDKIVMGKGGVHGWYLTEAKADGAAIKRTWSNFSTEWKKSNWLNKIYMATVGLIAAIGATIGRALWHVGAKVVPTVVATVGAFIAQLVKAHWKALLVIAVITGLVFAGIGIAGLFASGAVAAGGTSALAWISGAWASFAGAVGGNVVAGILSGIAALALISVFSNIYLSRKLTKTSKKLDAIQESRAQPFGSQEMRDIQGLREAAQKKLADAQQLKEAANGLDHLPAKQQHLRYQESQLRAAAEQDLELADTIEADLQTNLAHYHQRIAKFGQPAFSAGHASEYGAPTLVARSEVSATDSFARTSEWVHQATPLLHSAPGWGHLSETGSV